MRLKDMKTVDFKEGQKYDFIFPLWATEQHGPFIPLGTDTYITDYIINQVEQQFSEIIILPTLEVSRSQEHRSFFGTLWLSEETLEHVLFDICNSLKDKAKTIFIYSFHANGPYIDKFIKNNSFEGVNIIQINESTDEDCIYIEKNILQGPLDGHAGNSEISNMLVLQEKLVNIPQVDYPKYDAEWAFDTDNIIEKCPNGIADSHPQRRVNKKIGQEILDIYVSRIIQEIKYYLK